MAGTGHRAQLWAPQANPRDDAEGTELSIGDRQTAAGLKCHRDTGRCPQGHTWVLSTEGAAAGY